MMNKFLMRLIILICLNIAVAGSAQASQIWATEVLYQNGTTNSGNALGSPDGAYLNMGLAGQAIFGFGTLFDTALQINGSGSGGVGVYVYSGASPLTNPFSSTGWTSVGQAGGPVTTIDLTGLSGPEDGPFSYVGLEAIAPLQTLSSAPDGPTESDLFSVDSIGANPVPEPATMALFGLGLIGLAGVGRREKSNQR